MKLNDIIDLFMRNLGVEDYTISTVQVSYTYAAGTAQNLPATGEYGWFFLQTWAYSVSGSPKIRVISNCASIELNNVFPPPNTDLNGLVEPFEGEIQLNADTATAGDRYELTFIKVVPKTCYKK